MPAAIRKTVQNSAAQPTHWNSAGQGTERPASISSSSRQLDYNRRHSVDASDASLECGRSRQSCWSASVQQPSDSENNNAHTMVTIDYAPGPDAVSKIMVKRVVPIDSPIAATCRDVQPALPPDCPDVAATRNIGASKSCISEMTMMMKPDGTGIFIGSLVPRDGSTEGGNKVNLSLMSSQPNAEISPEQHFCHKAASQQVQNRSGAFKAQPKEPCRAAEMPPEIPMEPPNVHRRPSRTPEKWPDEHRRPSKTSVEPPNAHRRSSKTPEKPPNTHRRSSKTPEKPPKTHRRSSKTPEKPPNTHKRLSKQPQEPQNVPRRLSKAPEEPPLKLQQEQIKSQRKLSTEEQPTVPVKKVSDAEKNETGSKNVRSNNRVAAKVDCDSLLTSTRSDRRNSRVTFAQEPGAVASHCCKPNAGSISQLDEIKRLDDGRGQDGRKPESYAIYDSYKRKFNSGGKDDECISHDKVQASSTPATGQGSWGKQGKASDKNAIEERWHGRHPCAAETKAGEANKSEESKDMVTEGFSSAGEVQSKVYDHQCKQRTPDKKVNMLATKKMQQQSDGCGGRSETTLIYKAELETFPDESEESSKDKYNAESDSEAIVEIELDSRTNDTDERAGACGSQSTGTQTEPDRGCRSENPCHPERWKPAAGSARHTCSESRSEKPDQLERVKPTDRSEKTQKQPPDSTAGEQQQNGESFDIPESCLEALRRDAELKRRREAAEKARCETMQKLLTKRPDITTAPSEREKKGTHAQSQWKKATDANMEGERTEKPVEEAEAPTKTCPGGNHEAEKSTGKKCSPDPPDTTWVRKGNLLIKMSDGQPSSYKVLSRDVGSGDIYSMEKSEGSAWDINSLVPPPEESILDESAASSEVKAGVSIGERIRTDEDSNDPVTGKKTKCCC